MWVLTRRVGETIVIDGRIRVTILEICENRIRLSVEAPRDVRVDRAELLGARAGSAAPVDYQFEAKTDGPK
jgi:carbon storage regulator